MTQIKLEVGKKYRSRKGEVVEIVKFQKDNPYDPYISKCGKPYCPSGSFYANSESGLDLIEEVIEPAQEPVKKPIKWAKEAHAWIDGIEVEWQDCLDGSWVKATLMNPITDPHLNWRIKPQEVPQWRKDLAEKMKAGGVLEFRITQDSYWMPASADINDVLDAECGMHESQYRIKPEPKPDVVEFYVKFPHDALVLHGADFEWVSENGKKCPQLKVIWDSEGNLKDAEVLK